MTTIGFIGLGTMGRPMAANLLRGGFSVRGFDLDAAAVAAHAAGGIAAASAREAADGADIVITMLPDGPDVEAAILGENGIATVLKPGAVLIDMSTISPEVTRRVGDALAGRGIAMIDSPVGKTADHAVAGTLTLMVGGDADVIARVRPALDCMGKDFFHCGPLGTGSAMKLTNNFLAASILAATSEALVLGVKAGLTFELMRSIMQTTMAWNNQLAVALPKKGLAGDFAPGFMVRLAEKDQRLAVTLAETLGVRTPVGDATRRTLLDAGDAGLASHDVTAVLKLREEEAGVVVRSADAAAGVA